MNNNKLLLLHLVIFLAFSHHVQSSQTCPKGQHYSSGTCDEYNFCTPGGCITNNRLCETYDAANGSCKKCNWYVSQENGGSSGDYCELTWWIVLLMVLAGCLLFFVIMGVLLSCCKGNKKSKSYPKQGRSYSTDQSLDSAEQSKVGYVTRQLNDGSDKGYQNYNQGGYGGNAYNQNAYNQGAYGGNAYNPNAYNQGAYGNNVELLDQPPKTGQIQNLANLRAMRG